ncbi:anti-sigma factor antagonist [Dyella solisilvae]|uniref:Anti-sigma factor antagonist n=1 Tax=Dyella solisilvae TaxID=1920168 RepID=A0A370K778_9GAMM|nr:STAS domain-containing protein [Dyella solisilvae]RDI98472.1 anti-sigma factor antagonist [Dyella solisilvae]
MTAVSLPPRIDEGAPGSVRVSGELTFGNAAIALEAINAAVARDGRSTLDLSGVTRSDSAGLACVLAVLAQAAERGRALRVSHVPAGMQLLASVCEVDALMS